MSEADVPPRAEELEVSLFGPGFGECVLVHLGAGDWLLVDSCIEQRSQQQPALRYLRRIGHDPAEAVKCIVATHWHDDHVRGLAEVVRACPRAAFYCSAALTEEEALVFFGTQASHTYGGGAREFYDVLEALEERVPPGPFKGITPMNLALRERRVFHRQAGGSSSEAEVVALSPSDASVVLAKMALQALMPQRGAPPRYAAWKGPNHNAVVLWVAVGGVAVLLGADLEETGHPQMGWTAIVDAFDRARGEVFKVPHHGSQSAHHAGVWTKMLKPAPLAALTPFARGSVELPTPADRQRICDYTPYAFITAPRARFSPGRRDPVVDQMMRDMTTERSELGRRAGHIRLRRVSADSREEGWEVRLFDGAERLQPLSASSGN